MKHVRILILLLVLSAAPVALGAGCAPTANGESQGIRPVSSGDATWSPTTPTRAPSDTPTELPHSEATPTAAATKMPARGAAATGTASATPVPAVTATATPKAKAIDDTPTPIQTSTPTTGNAGALEGAAADGLAIYRAQFCGICHQSEVAGTAGTFGPSHNGFASTADGRIQDPGYTGEARTAEEYIRESILHPEQYVVEGYELSSHRMPAYTTLSAAELNALVQFLLQQE
jgi:cytochrome c551/c552